MERAGVHLQKSVKAEGRAERAVLGTQRLQDLCGYGILASTTAEGLRHHLTDGETEAQMDGMTWPKPRPPPPKLLMLWICGKGGAASEVSIASSKHLPFDTRLCLSLSHACWWGVGSRFHGNRQTVHKSKRKVTLTCPIHAPSP